MLEIGRLLSALDAKHESRTGSNTFHILVNNAGRLCWSAIVNALEKMSDSSSQ